MNQPETSAAKIAMSTAMQGPSIQTTAYKPANLSSLPPELLQFVYKNIEATSPSDLYSLCMTSKRLEAFARPLIWAAVIAREPVAFFSSPEFVHSRPQLGWHIRTLVVHKFRQDNEDEADNDVPNNRFLNHRELFNYLHSSERFEFIPWLRARSRATLKRCVKDCELLLARLPNLKKLSFVTAANQETHERPAENRPRDLIATRDTVLTIGRLVVDFSPPARDEAISWTVPAWFALPAVGTVEAAIGTTELQFDLQNSENWWLKHPDVTFNISQAPHECTQGQVQTPWVYRLVPAPPGNTI